MLRLARLKSMVTYSRDQDPCGGHGTRAEQRQHKRACRAYNRALRRYALRLEPRDD